MGIKLTNDERRDAANSVRLKPYTLDGLECAKREAIADAATAQVVREIGKKLTVCRYASFPLSGPLRVAAWTINASDWEEIRREVGAESFPGIISHVKMQDYSMDPEEVLLEYPKALADLPQAKTAENSVKTA